MMARGVSMGMMKTQRMFLVFSSVCLLLQPALRAQQVPHGQDKPPGPALSPAEAVKRMTVPAGFSVELVASEPDIVNPLAMTFDERGRLWVTERLEYPRSAPAPPPHPHKLPPDTHSDLPLPT